LPACEVYRPASTDKWVEIRLLPEQQCCRSCFVFFSEAILSENMTSL
jgi:hypothetical protein